MNKINTLMWFRQDLRLADNPALSTACKNGDVLPIYIYDDYNPKKLQIGEASQWWLHHALVDLNESLEGQLHCYRGNPQEIIAELVAKHQIQAVYWNRCYEPWQIERDTRIKTALKELDVEVKSFNGSLLWEPWEINKPDGTPYKVFTAFYKKGCLNALSPRKPLQKPRNMSFITRKPELLNLLPPNSWHKKLEPLWQVGEESAHKQLKKFLNKGIEQYKLGRDFPAANNVSRLSPYLHFGQLSPNQAWHQANKVSCTEEVAVFHKELGWREFSHYLLYHFPKLPSKNWNSKFDKFPWRKNKKLLMAWQEGQTGYPIIDAGMRELWQTGYMHNRIRMVVASFLIKNCLVDWREGAAWFWDCLLDADLANNSASWQWVAGCGADAAPYFRIFNPVTQGQKFDADGSYTKLFVPELKKMPDKYLFNPWDAPKAVLDSAGIVLGSNYPKPILMLKETREEALLAYQTIK